MINQPMLDYIKQKLQQGASKEQIKSSLLKNTWGAEDVDEAFLYLDSSTQVNPTSKNSSLKSINKPLLIVASVIIGLLVLGAGAFAYFNYFESPEKSLEKMISKLNEVTSLDYSGELKFFFNDDKGVINDDNYLLLNISHSYNITDPDNELEQIIFNIKNNSSLLGSENSNFGLEARGIGDSKYIKITGDLDLGFFDLSFLADQWVEININELEEGLGYSDIETEIRESQENKGSSLEELKEALKLKIKQAQIFKITKKLGSEKIEEINTYHYKFIIDKEVIKTLLRETVVMTENEILEEINLTYVDDILDQIELPSGEIWIGKKDSLPYKITLNSTINTGEEKKNINRFTATLLLKNYNQPVEIKAPSSAKKLEEVLQELANIQAASFSDSFFTANESEYPYAVVYDDEGNQVPMLFDEPEENDPYGILEYRKENGIIVDKPLN